MVCVGKYPSSGFPCGFVPGTSCLQSLFTNRFDFTLQPLYVIIVSPNHKENFHADNTNRIHPGKNRSAPHRRAGAYGRGCRPCLPPALPQFRRSGNRQRNGFRQRAVLWRQRFRRTLHHNRTGASHGVTAVRQRTGIRGKSRRTGTAVRPGLDRHQHGLSCSQGCRHRRRQRTDAEYSAGTGDRPGGCPGKQCSGYGKIPAGLGRNQHQRRPLCPGNGGCRRRCHCSTRQNKVPAVQRKSQLGHDPGSQRGGLHPGHRKRRYPDRRGLSRHV